MKLITKNGVKMIRHTLQTFWSWSPSGKRWHSGGRGGHPIKFSRPLIVMRRLGTEEASRHYPASGTRLEAHPVPLESAEWLSAVGRPKPVKWKISRHRVGPEDKRVGSEVASLWQPTLQPTSVPPSG